MPPWYCHPLVIPVPVGAFLWGTVCLCLWSFRILKEIKVSPITFKVMPNMVNTVSVVCRLEFVYGHHQLELNRPKGTILKNVFRFCWHLWISLWIQPIQFAFFGFNLNRDRNLFLTLPIYLSRWYSKSLVLSRSCTQVMCLESIRILNSEIKVLNQSLVLPLRSVVFWWISRLFRDEPFDHGGFHLCLFYLLFFN